MKVGPLGLLVVEVVRTLACVDGDKVASVLLALVGLEELDVSEIEVDAAVVTAVLDAVALIEADKE